MSWADIVRADFAVPTEAMPETLEQLTEALRSPDPVERDEQAYPILATWIRRGVLTEDQRVVLGDRMVRRFTDDAIQARAFAPLILASIVSVGTYRPAWFTAFAAWYPAETDTRGHDPRLGWLHAVAHGADLLGVMGGDRRVDAEKALALSVDRMIGPTNHVWRDQEDDRLAVAQAHILAREDLSETTAVRWLSPIDALLDEAEPGPVPAQASNTMRTLRMLYLLTDRGVRGTDGDVHGLTHADAVRDRLTELMARFTPWAW